MVSPFETTSEDILFLVGHNDGIPQVLIVVYFPQHAEGYELSKTLNIDIWETKR